VIKSYKEYGSTYLCGSVANWGFRVGSGAVGYLNLEVLHKVGSTGFSPLDIEVKSVKRILCGRTIWGRFKSPYLRAAKIDCVYKTPFFRRYTIQTYGLRFYIKEWLLLELKELPGELWWNIKLYLRNL
jgi:hypothetical protein